MSCMKIINCKKIIKYFFCVDFLPQCVYQANSSFCSHALNTIPAALLALLLGLPAAMDPAPFLLPAALLPILSWFWMQQSQ